MTAKAHAVTLGELVLFHPNNAPEGQPDPDPEVALVCHVNEDGTVNLCVFLQTGTSCPVHNASVQDPGVGGGCYCGPLASQTAGSPPKESHPKDVAEPHAKGHAHPHGKGHGHGHK